MADPQTRKLARQIVGLEERLHRLETVPQLAHSSIDDSALPVYDAAGELVARVGKQTDGTWGAPPIAGPTPPTPTGIDAVGGSGVIHLSWTGEFEGGVAAPLDFDTLEVLINGQLSGSLSNRDGGSVSVSAAEGNRFVSARVRTLVPRHSSTTSPFAVTVGPPPDELAAGLAEKLAGAEGAIADAIEELAEVGRVTTTGPPPADPVIGKSLWVSPSGRVYRAVECTNEEEAP